MKTLWPVSRKVRAVLRRTEWRRSALAFLAICWFGYGTFVSHTAVPARISYQGQLRDSDGLLVNDGNYTMVFSLFPQQIGGSQMWSETNSVSVGKGLFATSLGSVVPLPDAAFQGTT